MQGLGSLRSTGFPIMCQVVYKVFCQDDHTYSSKHFFLVDCYFKKVIVYENCGKERLRRTWNETQVSVSSKLTIFF